MNYALFFVFSLFLVAPEAWAQVDEPSESPHDFQIDEPAVTDEVEPVMVMEHEVTPMVGLYEITNDVNVRAGPGTDFERLAGLKAGERVRAIGKAQDTSWMAISQGGETVGFV